MKTLQSGSEVEPGLGPSGLVPLGILLWYFGSDAHLPTPNLTTVTVAQAGKILGQCEGLISFLSLES